MFPVQTRSASRWLFPLLLSLAVLLPNAAIAKCEDWPQYSYILEDIDELYPAINSAAMNDADRRAAVAASVQFYLQSSLARDQIAYCELSVKPDSKISRYSVSFRSSAAAAAQYPVAHPQWLSNGRLGLQGVRSCQLDAACWQPTGGQLQCAAPWQFYLPLGLPIVQQKLLMLLHYPPYVSMQQSDYLNNATLNRWQRLLTTVGVANADTALYSTIVDIFPIAAPGSGESGCFSTASAVQYFSSQGAGYVPGMLSGLALAVDTVTTLPVMVFGAEALGYWRAAYPAAPIGVNQAGATALAAGGLQTPYAGANHPIAAVYQTCSSTPGLIKMEQQDLASACFAKSMAATPGAVPAQVAEQCNGQYLSSAPSVEVANQVCAMAVVDKSPQLAPWSVAKARAWCAANQNQACPLPDYSK
ncbi:hypothetical protein VX159_14950 [Dechloromonas sp. ZY10]|uniref:hypothetical protein n=1 Tax=Dechloromonas aquae TaxID=2664436 RepID=UPI0035289B5B